MAIVIAPPSRAGLEETAMTTDLDVYRMRHEN